MGASILTLKTFSASPLFKARILCPAIFFTDKVLATKVIFPTAPQNKVTEAKAELKKLIEKYHVSLISVGNGTASRESEQVIVSFIKETGLQSSTTPVRASSNLFWFISC